MQTGYSYDCTPLYAYLCALTVSRSTGKERDTESGLDYFGARYYASNMGRWMSPDWAAKPEAVPYSDLMNPQSLNLYSYVNNNPLSRADADGHCYPLCTVAAGIVIGAGAEFISEFAAGQGYSAGRITAAAAGGAVIGFLGPAGAAAELGAVGTTAFAVGGAVAGGATQNIVNSALSGKQDTPNPLPLAGAAKDAAEAVVGLGVGKAAGTIAQPIVKQVVEGATNLVVDATRRVNDAKPNPVPSPNPNPAPPPPTPQPLPPAPPKQRDQNN